MLLSKYIEVLQKELSLSGDTHVVYWWRNVDNQDIADEVNNNCRYVEKAIYSLIQSCEGVED